MNVPPLRVMNPMTEEQEYLRISLRGNLLAALASNRRYEDGGIRLVELGREYLPQPNDLPEEPEILCGVMAGLRDELQWQGDATTVDFYDVKGVIEGLCRCLKLSATFVESQDKDLAQGSQAAVCIADTSLGVMGEVHPRILHAFDINEPVYLFEINVGKLFGFAGEPGLYRRLARFPSVVRDLALILDYNISHRQVNDIITSFPLVKEVRLFDVYSGEQVVDGKKSLAYRLIFQADDHTLTDAEVDGVQQKILSKLAKELGASLRS
jgi:phenylalanyl-tRNA synthetase beta chain